MPPVDVYTAVMSIPGADRALDFVQRQASAFAYIPTRLERIRRALAGIRARAAEQNNAVTVGKVAAVLSGLPRLQTLYASTSGKVSEIMTGLRLGTANPLVLVPKLLGAVAQMTLVFKSVELFERAVDGLARGTVTAEELARLRRGGFTVAGAANTALMWGLVGVGVWLLLRKGRR